MYPQMFLERELSFKADSISMILSPKGSECHRRLGSGPASVPTSLSMWALLRAGAPGSEDEGMGGRSVRMEEGRGGEALHCRNGIHNGQAD